MDSFRASKNGFLVQIGQNLFSTRGAVVDIRQDGIAVTGHIRYGPFTPIAYNIMGPFAFLPFMECNHAVHSLYHTLQGSILLNGRTVDFSDGRGYIEQDWGKSFPKKYAWLQTNDFTQENTCLFVSIATIPFMGCAFTGCICVLHFDQREYRLATYLGVRIREWSQSSIVLAQGKYTLQISVQSSPGQKLLAPGSGALSRSIHESPCCRAHIVFYKGSTRLFDQTSVAASFEYVE